MSSPPIFLRFASTFSRIADIGPPRQLSPCTTKSGFSDAMTSSYMMASCTAEDVQEIDTLAELETLRKSLKGKG